jgi:ubiquinone/menaquinone biosynthesis C-methylase UbiE
MTEILMRQGHRIIGLDLQLEGLQATHQALSRSWLLQAEATHLPIKENAFDVVMLLDVLEHVEDRIVLADVQRILRPGGFAVITVPAMPWLWSYRDKGAGHLRRYTRRKIVRILTNERLQVEELRYYQCLLFPFVIVTRLLGRRGSKSRDFEDNPSPILNMVMTWINELEVKLGEFIFWPWGSSLVIVCRK